MSQAAPRYISSELFPRNVARLTELGIRFAHRPGSRDIVTACGSCGGRLILDEEKPYALCFGSIRCEMSRVPFERVVNALAEEAGKA